LAVGDHAEPVVLPEHADRPIAAITERPDAAALRY